MGRPAVVVVDTSSLLNLATPVVDGRSRAPSGGDPFKAVVSAYDVYIPASVLGEVSQTAAGGDLLAAAAAAVLQSTHQLTVREVGDTAGTAPTEALDEGETHAIRLANELGAAMFVTDEFNATNYLLISLALKDRNTLFTTPHVVCSLARHGVLDPRYVDGLLTYYVETKSWDRRYIDQLRKKYLR